MLLSYIRIDLPASRKLIRLHFDFCALPLLVQSQKPLGACLANRASLLLSCCPQGTLRVSAAKHLAGCRQDPSLRSLARTTSRDVIASEQSEPGDLRRVSSPPGFDRLTHRVPHPKGALRVWAVPRQARQPGNSVDCFAFCKVSQGQQAAVSSRVNKVSLAIDVFPKKAPNQLYKKAPSHPYNPDQLSPYIWMTKLN